VRKRHLEELIHLLPHHLDPDFFLTEITLVIVLRVNLRIIARTGYDAENRGKDYEPIVQCDDKSCFQHPPYQNSTVTKIMHLLEQKLLCGILSHRSIKLLLCSPPATTRTDGDARAARAPCCMEISATHAPARGHAYDGRGALALQS
jgi:hypothetical protein